MPRKIRELKKQLRQAGFEHMLGRGKGSHSMWQHTRYRDIIVELSGNDGHDARRYHEQDVDDAVALIRQRDQEKP